MPTNLEKIEIEGMHCLGREDDCQQRPIKPCSNPINPILLKQSEIQPCLKRL